MTKRVLSNKEIESLLDFITPREGIPEETAMSIVKQHKDRYRKQLVGKSIYPEKIPALKNRLEKSYFESLIQAGESVGVTCGQSIGERNTQTTLSSFHKAGMSDITMTTGVPKFLELLNATKNPKVINHKIYFRKNNTSIQELRQLVGHDIVGLSLGNLSESMDTFMTKEPERWYDVHQLLYGECPFEMSAGIHVVLKQEKLYEYRLTVKEIVNVINDKFEDLFCVFSPPSIGQIDIYINTKNIDTPESEQVHANMERDDVIRLYLEDCAKPILEKLHICGIPGIKEIFYTKGDTKDGKTEWYVETNAKIVKKTKNSGNGSIKQVSAFKQILANPNVDPTRTVSNHLWDIYETLDIEATREYLLESFMSITDGIDACHPKTLTDKMTFGGTISSITRFTLKKEESGPLGKASFEEAFDIFLRAAATGESEHTEGVSASIVCGKQARIGTRMFDVGIDLDMLPEAVNQEDNQEDNQEEVVQEEKPKKKQKITRVKKQEIEQEVDQEQDEPKKTRKKSKKC